jgi:hypothetical protein
MIYNKLNNKQKEQVKEWYIMSKTTDTIEYFCENYITECARCGHLIFDFWGVEENEETICEKCKKECENEEEISFDPFDKKHDYEMEGGYYDRT